MNLRKSTAIFSSLIALGFASCNSGTSFLNDDTDFENSDVMVKSFKLKSDTAVAEGLEKVYFSIDLNKGLIFNADSLPYGCKTESLVPEVTGPDDVTSIEFIVSRPDKPDTTVVYNSEGDNDVDFSHGPVTMRVMSPSGHNTRDYKVQINVHQAIPDTMIWRDIAVAKGLPGGIATPAAQRTVKMGDVFYCLVTDGSNYAISTTDNPYDGAWETKIPSFDSEIETNSLMATSNALYLKQKDGQVITSSNGTDWSKIGIKAFSIISTHQDKVIFVQNTNGVYNLLTYPGNKTEELPEGFPVAGSTLPVEYTIEMQTSPVSCIVGGRMADGNLSSDTWAFDGNNWAKLSVKSLPQGLMGAELVPYFMLRQGNTTTFISYSIFILCGGHNKNGNLNRTVYYSSDYGMKWRVAGDYMQLPEDMPEVYNAQALTAVKVFDIPPSEQKSMSRSNRNMPEGALAWTPVKGKNMPKNAILLEECAKGRFATLPTQYDCTYIYRFGGISKEGKFQNSIWRGVLNRFTFIPIY